MGWLANRYPYTDLHELNLEWVIKVCQDVLKEVDGFPQKIQDLQTQINSVNSQISALQSQITVLQNRKWDWSKEILSAEQSANKYTDLQIQNLQISLELKLNELQSLVQQYYAELLRTITQTSASDRIYTDNAIEAVKIWAESIPLPAVINPLTGKLEGIDKVISDLFYYAKVNALTAEEYDSLGLTAEEYDSYNLTAYEYDFSAKAYLKPSQKTGPVINPFTGEYDSIQNVLDTLASYHKFGNTAEQYDKLDFTAMEYDNLYRTAYQYDMERTHDIIF